MSDDLQNKSHEEESEGLSCTDWETGRLVLRHVFSGEPSRGDDAVQQHLRACRYCRNAIEVWRHKAATFSLLNRYNAASEVIRLAQKGSPIILIENIEGGTLYFRPDQAGSETGILVVTDDSGNVLSVERGTRSKKK